MQRSKWWIVIGFSIAIIMFGVVIITTQREAAATSLLRPYHPPVAPTHLNVSQTYMPGAPAIPVKTSPGARTDYADTSLTPAFSAAEVTAFFNKYGFYAGPLVKGAHLKILSVQFITAKQASDLMDGESVGRPDTYLVCYVKVQGPFQLTQVHGGPHIPGLKSKATAETGDAVFDGHTGNNLVWGVYP